MLIDKRKIKVKSGSGGSGSVYFDKERRPTGGDGGNGGSVYFEGTINRYDFKHLKKNEIQEAENGERGGDNKMTGANARDLIIRVPLVTHIINENGEKVASIEKDGQRVLVAKGGRGGLGNNYFKKGQRMTLTKFTPGKPGESFDLELELNLAADIIFVGFPNAGKSSLLNTLTNANVKVAPYPFTTLEPYLGVAKGLVLMDLPGLIEGASEGKGMGTRFLNHMKFARAVAHFISLESDDVLRDYKTIRTELEELDPELAKKPEIIVLTKADMFDQEYIQERVKQLKNHSKTVLVTSSFDYDKVEEIENAFLSVKK